MTQKHPFPPQAPPLLGKCSEAPTIRLDYKSASGRDLSSRIYRLFHLLPLMRVLRSVSGGRDIRFLSLLQSWRAGERRERGGPAGVLPGQERGPGSLAGTQQSQGLPDVIYQTTTTFNVHSAIISFILIQSFPVELSRPQLLFSMEGFFFFFTTRYRDYCRTLSLCGGEINKFFLSALHRHCILMRLGCLPHGWSQLSIWPLAC